MKARHTDGKTEKPIEGSTQKFNKQTEIKLIPDGQTEREKTKQETEK